MCALCPLRAQKLNDHNMQRCTLQEQKLGGKDYAQSRIENERLKEHTMAITQTYMRQKNTIVLVVISATDWMHGMNNDNLISYLAEWLEEIREQRPVTVFGVIT
jgi:hypothetical protein